MSTTEATANAGIQPAVAGPPSAGHTTATVTIAASAAVGHHAGQHRRHADAPPWRRVHANGEQGPDEDLGQPRRRGVVRRVGPGGDRDHHRRDGAGGGQPGHRGDAARRRPAQHDDQHQRPHPVELLLDREAPVVVERRALAGRPGHLLGVAASPGEGDPVVDLSQRAPEVAAQVGDAVELAGPRRHHHAEQAHQAGRQQAAHPAGVERTGVEATGAIVLHQRQARDQEPRQREEHRHADVAARHPSVPGVEHQHHRHGDRPHPVERRLIAEPAILGREIVRFCTILLVEIFGPGEGEWHGDSLVGGTDRAGCGNLGRQRDARSIEQTS